MKLKKIIPAIILILSLCCVNAYAKTMQFTMGDYNAKVDEGTISIHKMEVAPYTVNGRTLVPVRIIEETFGADVKWINEENKVVITLGDKVINMVIGQAVATVNGKSVSLDVAPVLTNGRPLVPLRFVSETLDFDVKYLASTEQILITDNPAVMEVNGAEISLADYEAMYKLNLAKYGASNSQAAVADYTSMLLLQYAIYEAEAAKWGIALDPLYYSAVKESAEQFADFDDVLDASWISLLEMDYRSAYLVNFLKVLYALDEAMAEQYYNENYFAAKHIFVSDEATAKDILSQLKKGANFDSLMNKYSEDPGSAANPDGYVFTKGEMVEGFENATKGLEINKISDVVVTEYGYHIIKRVALPACDASQLEEISMAYVADMVAEHFNTIANSSEIKIDAYTIEQLIELCK